MAINHSGKPVNSWISLLMVTSLGGCSGFGGDLMESRQQITINSDPQNASVIANGVEIGSTPLVIKPDEVFETRFTGGDAQTEGLFVYRYVGSLSLKKPGCETYTTQVNDNILSKDIHFRLECDPDYRPAEVQPAVPAPAVAPTAKPAVTPSAKPAAAQPEAAVTAPAKPVSAPMESIPALPADSAEERLQRIESLYRKGLLSEEEYRTLRQRVLDTL